MSDRPVGPCGTPRSTPTCRRASRAPAAPRLRISSDVAEVAFPQPGATQFENLARLGAAHEVLERHLDGARVRLLAAHRDRFAQQLLTKHKIRPFHVYHVPTSYVEASVNRDP